MVSLCSAHQDASNDIHFELEVTLRSRDLRSPLQLDLMRSSYACSDAYQQQDLDSVIIFVLTQLVKHIIGKKSLVFKCPFFTFLPLAL